MLCDQETAERVAANIFNRYGQEGKEELSNEELRAILLDCYKDMENEHIDFDSEDLQLFQSVLDVNEDSKITLDDLKVLATKYLIEDIEENEKEPQIFNPPPLKQYKQEQRKVVVQQESYQIKTVHKQEPQVSNAKNDNLKTKPEQRPQQQQMKIEQYNKRTQNRMQIAERLFNQFQKNGYITEAEVKNLLNETYKQFGMAYEFNQKDAQSWMKMADLDNDGKVYIDDFQKVLLEGLVQVGINIY